MDVYDLTVKIILLGDYSVNKGTLLKALQALPKDEDVYCLQPDSPRMGMLEMLFVRHGKRVRVKIADTAGQERFRSVTSSYYRGAHGCLLLFDVTNVQTFNNLPQWQEELKHHTTNNDLETVLVGCNGERPDRQVSKNAAQEYAHHLGMAYEEVSVKIISSLLRVLEQMVDSLVVKASINPTFSLSITPLSSLMNVKQIKQEQERTEQTCAC